MITRKHIDTWMAQCTMLSKNFLVLLVLMLCVLPSFSQKQVTLDRTRLAADRNKKTVAEKRAIAKKETTKESASNKSRSQRHRRRKVAEPKLATYLTVNGYGSQYNDNMSYTASYRTYLIRTDGQNFNCSCLPVWCHASTSSSGYLYLSVDENFSYDARSDWFYVNSDNQRVKVSITQEGKPVNVSASVGYINVCHDVYRNGYSVIDIQGYFDIKQGSDLEYYAVAFVQTESGTYISGSTSFPAYRQNNGTLCGAANTSRESSYSTRHNFDITIPNNALYIGTAKKMNLKLVVSLYCIKTGQFISGTTRIIPFKVKKKKDGIHTMED